MVKAQEVQQAVNQQVAEMVGQGNLFDFGFPLQRFQGNDNTAEVRFFIKRKVVIKVGIVNIGKERTLVGLSMPR